jgi:flagellin
MSTSINTNIGAMMARSALRTAGAQLDVASKKVQTGYRVSDAMDDASTFSVAQGIRGNLQAYQAVQQSLTNGAGLGSVTDAALTNISNIIGNMQAKITQLADGSISANQRTIYTADLNAMTSQIANFISQANYNGNNLLSAGSAARTVIVDTNANTFSLTSQSAVNAAFTTFSSSSVASASAATLALTSLNTFAQAVNSALSNNASNTRSLNLQNNFINAQVDAIQQGLGATVDADIGKASAEVQAREVQRQLGVQSLSLANQQPSTLLGIFR